MNSALQCLLHTDVIKEVFLYKNIEEEINKNNPLGTKGDLLLAFIQFIREYYTTTDNEMNISSFNKVLTKYLTTFEGYS